MFGRTASMIPLRSVVFPVPGLPATNMLEVASSCRWAFSFVWVLRPSVSRSVLGS